MKLVLAAFALSIAALATAPAQAAGCLKGAAVGGVAGHMAGHGVLGAAAGCVVGRHEANKSARQNAAAANQNARGSQSGNAEPARN